MNKKRRAGLLIVIALLCMMMGETVFAQAEIPEEEEIVDTSNHLYTYEEMEQDLVELMQKYPECITGIPIGVTCDYRNIWEVIIGNPNAPKAIFIEAAVHGREWMNSWMLMKQIEEILEQWETPIVEGLTLGGLFEQCAVYIMPMVNPDGVAISECGIEAIRNESLRSNLRRMDGAKNPGRWKANAAGVDINRNFSIGWGNKTTAYAPAAQGYAGPSPLSEPETLAMVNVFEQRSFDLAISYHSMEGAIYWNVGQTGELLDKTRALATDAKMITGYKLGEQSPIYGLDYNWMIFQQNTPTILIETGTVACPLPYSQWRDLWNRNKDMIKMMTILCASK